MPTAIKIENLSKQYRLGVIGTGTLSHDLNRWWAVNVLRREDPYLKIGETNDRATRGNSEYVWALKDINMEIEQGDVVGIIGKNGAGKSTLLKLLSRVTKPTTGTIKYRGRIASLLEVGTGFHPEMTGRENIYMNGAIMGMTRAEITRKLDEIVDFSGCERYLDTPVKRYSSGMTVRLGFAIAAHLDPEILVVDEVLAVGDAEFQKKAIGKMQDVSKGEGRTVLFVSHNMGAVRNLCKTGFVLKNGMIDFCGTAESAINHYLATKVDCVTTFRTICKEENLTSAKTVGFLTAAIEKGKCSFSFKEPISFLFEIKANKTVFNCRINATIVDAGGASIGSVSNDEFFNIEKDEKKTIRFTIFDHNLAAGQYSISFSIGTGNYKTGQTDFDIIFSAFSFDIDTYDENIPDSKFCAQWNVGWGNIMFPHKTEVI
ncbi:MAG: ABC transporter ATP-binding protein [Salinivirgaceae bacterium]|nr:ABC transporter ATP-binding protein [Salinivirgaceae bacterium]